MSGRTHLLLGGRRHLDQAACGRIAGDYKRFRVTFGADQTTCRDCLRETGLARREPLALSEREDRCLNPPQR